MNPTASAQRTEFLSERLWEANADMTEACLIHPFVRGIGAGTLDLGAFRRYVGQDAYFLKAFGRAYAMAAARSSTIGTFAAFHRLMGGVLEELALHRKYAESLRIDLSTVRPLRATRTYTDFLMRVAAFGAPSEIMAALTPCMRLYSFLGQSLAAESGKKGKFGDWIDTYSSDAFAEVVRVLENLLNKLGEDTPETADAYRYALECELEFFSAPLDPNAL